MYAEERQQHILDRARAAGRVEVNTLAEALDVTPETVRRDLTILERYGVLRRVCLLYTSPSPRDGLLSRMPSSA